MASVRTRRLIADGMQHEASPATTTRPALVRWNIEAGITTPPASSRHDDRLHKVKPAGPQLARASAAWRTDPHYRD